MRIGDLMIAAGLSTLLVAGACLPSAARAPARARGPSVFTATVNGVALTAAEIRALAQRGVTVRPGRFWYDARCGAWGYVGQGTAGVLPAGLPVRAPMWRGISNGRTGVVVNGRELTAREVRDLSRLGRVVRGRYWVDAAWNFGFEGGPRLGNLAVAARGQRRSVFHRGRYTGIGAGESGGTGYVMGDGWSVTYGP